MSEPVRVVSVGVSRLFRIVEMDSKPPSFQIQQAVKIANVGLIKDGKQNSRWKWEPRVLVHGPRAWGESHGALHKMQAEYLDELARRRAMKVRSKVVGS